MGDSEFRASGIADEVAECERQLMNAKRLLQIGELHASGEAAIRAGELARLAGRPDLLASAALAITGIQDPLIDAGVELMCHDAIKAVGATDAALLTRLHAQLAIAQYHRGRIGDASMSTEHAMRMAAQTDDPAASAAALHARQMIVVGLVRPDEMIELGQRMLALATKASGRPTGTRSCSIGSVPSSRPTLHRGCRAARSYWRSRAAITSRASSHTPSSMPSRWCWSQWLQGAIDTDRIFTI